MTSFPVLGKADLDDGQRLLWDKLTLGPRGFYTGGAEATKLPELYNAWLQFPEFGDIVLQLGDAIRAQTELSGRLRELVVLTTASLLGARVEFDFHVPFARRHGIAEEVIAALGRNERPDFDEPLERTIYEAAMQLTRMATLSESTRTDVIAAIGHRGLMQLIATVTLYVLTAYTMNVSNAKLADDFSANSEKLQQFYAGASELPEQS